MGNKTNDEKLKILHERLAQIKEKKDIALNLKRQQEKELIGNSINDEIPQERTSNSIKWFKYVILSFCIVFGFFYAYNNLDITSFKTENNQIKKADEISIDKENLEYTIDFKGQKNIVITGRFVDESEAQQMAKNLEEEGFKVDYFYLPNKSNSTKKVYEVFIGPYENDEETSQWIKNLQIDYKIITLDTY